MKKGFLLLLGVFMPCFGRIEVFENPAQQFNLSDNYANRLVYFFIIKDFDGTMTLQIEPPPYYAEDADLLDSGIAQFDIETVVQEYSAAEAAATSDAEISFTVTATPNQDSDDGYYLETELFQWMVNLDRDSDFFEHLQSFNMIYYSEDDLVQTNINPDGGSSIQFFEVEDNDIWYSAQRSAFLSPSLIDSAYYRTETPLDPYSTDFTFKVDLARLSADAAPGSYVFYLVFQMEVLTEGHTRLEDMLYYGVIQQTQLNELYDFILAIDGDLNVSTNNLYVPTDIQRFYLQENKDNLIASFEEILDAITVQWNAYAAERNLSPAEREVVNEMLAYITLANNEISQF